MKTPNIDYAFIIVNKRRISKLVNLNCFRYQVPKVTVKKGAFVILGHQGDALNIPNMYL